MKTKNTFIKLAFLSLLTLLQMACNKGTNSTSGLTNTGGASYYLNNGYCYSNTGQTVPTNYCNNNNSGYYMNGGYCYSNNGQVVSNNYCSSTAGAAGYTWSNGYCYSSNGQVVSNTYCSSNSNMGMGSQQCMGTYYYMSGSGYTPVSCNGTNCRGYTLYNQNGTQVYCQ